MKRRHEEIAKSEFDALIRWLFPNVPIAWEDVPQVQEPPDWYLTIGSSRYAVEATSIVEYILICDEQVPSSSIAISLHRFIDEVEAISIQQGILTGAYVVWFCPVPDFSARKAEIRRRLLDYIRDTQNAPAAPRTDVLEVGDQVISIQKFHNEGRFVAECISFTARAKIESEVQRELSNALAAVLEDKATKLLRVCKPVILLILDAYYYADISQWFQAVSESLLRNAFHSICRIAPPDPAVILWSVDPKWLSRPFEGRH